MVEPSDLPGRARQRGPAQKAPAIAKEIWIGEEALTLHFLYETRGVIPDGNPKPKMSPPHAP